MLVYLHVSKEVRHDLMTNVETYYFVITKDWWGINELPLCLGVGKTITVCKKMCLGSSSLLLFLFCVQTNL